MTQKQNCLYDAWEAGRKAFHDDHWMDPRNNKFRGALWYQFIDGFEAEARKGVD